MTGMAAPLGAFSEHSNFDRAQHAIVDAEFVNLPVEVWVSGEGRTTDEVIGSVSQIGWPQHGGGLLRNLRPVEIDGDTVVTNADRNVSPFVQG